MNWHLFAFIAPALWATCNYMDKYVLTRYFKEGSTAVLVIVSGFAAFLGGLIILLAGVHLSDPSLAFKLILLGNGALGVVAFVPYFYALRDEDASIVIPIFQTIPVFGYVLGFVFLGEHLSGLQILAGLIIIAGAFGLSLDLGEKIRVKTRTLLLMLLCSFLLAVVSATFKKIGLQEGYWTTTFWDYMGSGLVALLMVMGVTSWRKGFLDLVMRKRAVLGIGLLQEAFNLGASLMATFAALLAPIAIVSVVVNGLQPLYVFVFGVLLTVFFPNHFNERITKKDIVQKVAFFCVIFLGTVLLGRV